MLIISSLDQLFKPKTVFIYSSEKALKTLKISLHNRNFDDLHKTLIRSHVFPFKITIT